MKKVFREVHNQNSFELENMPIFIMIAVSIKTLSTSN